MLLTGDYQPVDDNQKERTAGQLAARPIGLWAGLNQPQKIIKNNC
jgi:hypothetical protein